MTFKVRWSEEALSDLGNIWLNAAPPQRAAITVAAHEIDRSLQTDPESEGESRLEGRRVYFEAPLGILFTVDAQSQIVTVTQAWLVRKRHA